MMMKLTSDRGLVIINSAHVTAVVLAQPNKDPYKSRIYVDSCEADSWFQVREAPEVIWDMMEKEATLQALARRPLWKRVTDRLGITTI